MAEQNKIATQTFVNGEASSTISQYRVAILDTTTEGQVKLPSGANSVEKIAGVTEADISATRAGSLVIAGIAYCTAAAAISIGDVLVIADTAGRVRPKASGATAQGLAIVGVALGTATTSGDQLPVMLEIRNAYAS